jgi:hypothetical protein
LPGPIADVVVLGAIYIKICWCVVELLLMPSVGSSPSVSVVLTQSASKVGYMF